MRLRLACCLRLAMFVLLSATVVSAGEVPWHESLYLANGDYWHARVAVRVSNESDPPMVGEPVAVPVGAGAGQANIAGADAGTLRVCDARGTEMLFNVVGPDGRPIRRGSIPTASTLTIPVECPAQGQVTYFVYFDNPAAWPVPDFLEASVAVRNGRFEAGTGDSAFGWVNDRGDREHRAFWVREGAHSGAACLKTVVAPDAEATWIATRQSGLRIIGGARYLLTGWVKAQNVHGYAGWYIHVGNHEQPMMLAPGVPAGDGTFDWKQVHFQFTAPDNATLASLGTVLRGTGTAWFDDVSLECVGDSKQEIQVDKVQRLDLRATGATTAWLDDDLGDSAVWNDRLPVRVFNVSNQAIDKSLVLVNVESLSARLRGRLPMAAVRVVEHQTPLQHYRLGHLILFEAHLPARSVSTFYVYFSDKKQAANADATDYVTLLDSDRNLVRNASFEAGDPLPTDWTMSPATTSSIVTFGINVPGRFGKRAVRLHVVPRAQTGWRGWHQDVPVRPGREYLLAGWLKCVDVRNGTVQLHAHCRQADGTLSATRAFNSVGPGITGTSDWTLMRGRIRMPSDAVRLQLHLTMNATGTVWHDGLLVAEVIAGLPGPLEERSEQSPDKHLAVWQVPAVVKVFREDLPPKQIGQTQMTAARNEPEPLQMAIRSVRDIEEVRVVVEPPTSEEGQSLPAPEIAVVGYVPVDHPTNYYRSDVPAWQRKFPRTAGRCDGWTGWWPDPLLPDSSFQLKSHRTQAIWITVHVPETAAAGRYTGSVQLLVGTQLLKQIPFTVQVWNFRIPKATSFSAIYDVRYTSRWRQPSQTSEQFFRQMWLFMADRRVCPDRVQPEPTFRYQDGQVVADFTEFDRAAEYYFNELHLPHSYMPQRFYCFGWGHPPKPIFGEAPYEGTYPYQNADRSRLRPAYQRIYQACLKTFWNHIKERGWADRFVLYISDEPWYRLPEIRLQMKALCQMIHEVDSAIRVYSSTWQHYPDWDGALNVWGIGHDGRVPESTIAKLRSDGAAVWFTTDGQMCLDTPHCAVERLLPHYCFRFGVDAYEFWGVNWLTYDPFQFGWHAYIHQSGQPGESHWVRYPNGDGYLIYPGASVGKAGPVSSIRLEQVREGVEDYEYLCLLRDRIAQARQAGRDIRAAEAVLQHAQTLVNMPNAGGRYSTSILPQPESVFVIKESLARAIEELTR